MAATCCNMLILAYRRKPTTHGRGGERLRWWLSRGSCYGAHERLLLRLPSHRYSIVSVGDPEQLADVEVGPGGSGLHCEVLDVDLSVPGLLFSALGRSQKLSELARIAGQVSTPAKAAAARANGAKGGRPRKVGHRN